MIIAITALIVLYPVALVFYQSFLSEPFFSPAANWTLDAYTFVTTDEYFHEALINTLIIAVGMTVIAVPFGALLAFLMVRTDLPGKGIIEPFIMTPIFISPMVLAFGYVVAAGPVGLVSIWAKQIFGQVPWYLYSMTSFVVIAGLTHVPHAYLYAASALRNIGSDVEEAARCSGAGPLRVAMTVSLPMITPSLCFSALLIFFLGFEMFGLPLVLGDPEGITVLATYLYKLTSLLGTPAYQMMAVVVVFIFLVSIPLVYLQRRVLMVANRYISVKGKAAGQRPLPIGGWKWVAAVVIALWILVTVIVPIGGLVLRASLTTWGEGVVLLDALTFDHFRELFMYPQITRSIVNTLLMATVGGALAVGAYCVLALATHRRNDGWTRLMDYVVLLPRAMPGLVAGLAIFWVFLFTPFMASWRQTLISVWLAYTIVWLAYGLRLISAAFMQISPDLEEAARVAGASGARASRDVTLPLARAGILGSWLLIFIMFTREYSTGVYLLSPGAETIGSLLVSLWAGGNIDSVTALATVNLGFIAVGVLLLWLFGERRNG
nr:iron ABC transporter permease [Agrobacterium tumefaciens]